MFTRLLAETGDASYSSFIKILESLKEETLIIQNEKDLDFFVSAMEMASQQFCNRQAGEMVNELLLAGENYKFIGNNYRVSFLHSIAFCPENITHREIIFCNNKIYMKDEILIL